jgi:hypothetical protein
MRMTGLSLALVVVAQAACLAETPELAGRRSEPAGLFSRSRMFNNQNWWTRFGEPVNAEALAATDGIKGDVAPAAMYGHDYIYGPGSCDCPPPCIDDLWSGYYQHPKRCDGYHGLFGRCGHFGGGCGHCGGRGCGHCGGKLFGHHKGCGCGDHVSCTTKAACDCPAPSCTSKVDSCCAPICGGKKAHFAHKWKCFKAHWNRDCCDSCSAPLGCGSALPLAPEVQIPSEKQAITRPQPLPEDAALLVLPRIN